MAVLRIRCRPNIRSGAVTFMTDITDLEVFVVHDDGSEEPLQNVEGVSFHAESQLENKIVVVLNGGEVDLQADGVVIDPGKERST